MCKTYFFMCTMHFVMCTMYFVMCTIYFVMYKIYFVICKVYFVMRIINFVMSLNKLLSIHCDLSCTNVSQNKSICANLFRPVHCVNCSVRLSSRYVVDLNDIKLPSHRVYIGQKWQTTDCKQHWKMWASGPCTQGSWAKESM